jgi:membrane peptidoglycan carboxypeptidase
MKAMTTRKRRLLIVVAVILVLVGATAGSAALYVGSVPLPALVTSPETTTVYYADGKTEMARLGAERRVALPRDRFTDVVWQAAVAAEDPDFFGSTGGPIARSVVRNAMGLKGSGTSTRLKVYVMARKLDDAYTKDQILEMYLNAMPFGRGAFGVEAAAQAYFGKSVEKDSSRVVSPAEAIALATVIDQTGTEPSQSRWTEVRDAMVDQGYLTRAAADALAFPPALPYDPKRNQTGLDRPTGLVVNHVLAEIVASPQFRGQSWDAIRNGGYTIVTTVDVRAQAALEAVVDPTATGSLMNGQPKELQAAGVLVQPGTGRVLAYYGGASGIGSDYAGWYLDEDGVATGYGAHRAGTSFMPYALAAALKDGISLDSMWDSRSPRRFPGRTEPIRNVSACTPPHGTRNGPCTLLGATLASLEVPYYSLTQAIGSATVLEMAKAAGIRHMWNDDRKRIALDDHRQMAEVSPKEFNTEVALGQYPVTVVDHATGMATFAAGGQRATTHFVRQVKRGEDVVYSEALPTEGQGRVLNDQQAADLTWALSQTSAGRLRGIDTAGKTGVWIDGVEPTHAWMVGYTTDLAAAIWVGSAGRERPLRDSQGRAIFGAGLPAQIYTAVMGATHADMLLKPGRFGPPAHVGDADRGDSAG